MPVMMRVLMLCLPLSAAAEELSSQRSAFISTLALIRTGMPQTAEIEALQSYPLYPYLHAARLLRLLADAPDDNTDNQIAAFLDTSAGQPWSRELRKAWLPSLADRKLWPLFLRYYEDNVADTTLRCQQLRARLEAPPELGAQEGLVEAALTRWMSADEQPDVCNHVFVWLQAQGALTEERIEQRARLALKAGKAKVARLLAGNLPAAKGDPLLRWANLIQTPKPELERLIGNPKLEVETDALLDGFSRLAKADSEDALELYRPLLKFRDIPKARHVDFTRALALGLALDRKPQAIEQYQDVPEKALDDRDHEWRLRAALWNGEWKLALRWLKALPAPLAAQTRWRYWRARALAETGHADEARPFYEALIAENGYHSVLAAQRLGQAFVPHNVPAANDPGLQGQLAQLAALQRAREAAAVGEYAWVGAEWRMGMEGMTAAEKLQAARLAGSWGLYEQAVSVTSSQQVFDDLTLLYPLPFTQEVAAAALYSGLLPEWIYSVMRQESLFRPDAVSSAGALGLLQLLPRTAREVAKRWERPMPSPDDLKNPQINLPLGAAHLRELTEKLGSRYIFALAAYNAGPNALARWLPERPQDAEVWIENIPYNETRTYVQRILWNITVYGWRASGQPQNLTALLQPVVKLPPEGS
jgi:soluble lytic murein transglycosylase